MSLTTLLVAFAAALPQNLPQPAAPQAPAPQWRRAVMPKPIASALPIAAEQTRVVVKLAERRPELVAGGRIADPAILRTIGARPAAPFFAGREQELATVRARQREALPAGVEPPVDLALYFEVLAASAADAREVVLALNALESVELAYPRELPAPPPGDILPVTADFTANQGYRAPAPNGFDGATLLAVTGASGAGVKVLDIEWGWELAHEDLGKLRPGSLVGPPISNATYNNHGTAVIGEMAADADIYGVTGLVPDVQVFVATNYPATGYSVAAAILVGLPVLGSGDVMLLEAQTSTPLGLGPTEWLQADFDAIVTATTLGVITVEAAGNGNVDLDSPVLGGLFNLAVRDSGAIIVGATEGVSLTKASFSCHGSRIDANGWGRNVASTGYGDLFNPNDVRQRYTATFSGTSSASPMVTAAVIALRGGALAQLAPAQAAALNGFAIRALLRAHGSPVPAIARRPDTSALLAAAGIAQGMAVRGEPATGQSCFVDLVPGFPAGAGDFWAMVGGLDPVNVLMPAPYLGRVLIDPNTSVPLAFGSFATTPGTLPVNVPADVGLRGLRYLVQGYTLVGATNEIRAVDCATLFVRR